MEITPPRQAESKGFTIPDPPHEADLYRCVHCGLCLNSCPTYRLTGLETESPRGRIFLITQLATGAQRVNQPFAEHIGLCLNCRNCETVCPSGVRYSVLVEAARGEIVRRGKLSARERLIRWAVLRQLFPYPQRLNMLVAAMNLYQRSLQPIVRKTRLLKVFGRLGELEALLPAERPLRAFRPRALSSASAYEPRDNMAETSVMRQGRLARARAQEKRGHVALFTGCIMRAGFADIHEATVRVLERNGYEVSAPEAQVCCGALHVHAGERDLARELAQRNIDLFLRENYDAILVNAAGCGAQLKEYAELFRANPQLERRAQEFARRVKDVSELLASELVDELTLPRPTRATYQDACHLAHAQKITAQPRQILKRIRNLELVEMQASDRCCGSGGIYNIVHPEIADQLIDEKIKHIRETGARVVVTGNIGCLIQLEYGKQRAGWDGRVLHLVELLDEAYRNA